MTDDQVREMARVAIREAFQIFENVRVSARVGELRGVNYD